MFVTVKGDRLNSRKQLSIQNVKANNQVNFSSIQILACGTLSESMLKWTTGFLQSASLQHQREPCWEWNRNIVQYLLQGPHICLTTKALKSIIITLDSPPPSSPLISIFSASISQPVHFIKAKSRLTLRLDYAIQSPNHSGFAPLEEYLSPPSSCLS